MALIFLIPGVAFAQSQKITLNFDEKSLQAGQIAELKGIVDPSLAGKPVAVEVKDSQGQIIILRTVQPDTNGNFVLKFKVPMTITGNQLLVSSSIESEGSSINQTEKIPVLMPQIECAPDEEMIDGKCVQKITNVTPKCGPGTHADGSICVPDREQKKGCLIATAAYGTELSPQVQLLREVRDNVLFGTNSGTAFMTGFNEFYYSFSPVIADMERQNPLFKEAVKLTITPMLSTMSILNYANINSEQQMLGYGIGVILLNIGMYFVAPAIIIVKVIKAKK